MQGTMEQIIKAHRGSSLFYAWLKKISTLRTINSGEYLVIIQSTYQHPVGLGPKNTEKILS